MSQKNNRKLLQNTATEICRNGRRKKENAENIEKNLNSITLK